MAPAPRLTSSVWVSALIRRCAAAGVAATVLHRGYEIAGGIVLIARDRDGSNRGYVATTDHAGQRVWLAASAQPLTDAEAAPFVEAQIRRDPDLWVIEVETADPAAFMDEAVLSSGPS